MRRTLYRAMLILLLASAVRIIALDDRTLWYDEAFAVLFSETGLDAMLYGTLTSVDGVAADVHPLLYYATLNGWMNLTGQSPFAVRMLGVLAGIVTVAVVFRLAADLFDKHHDTRTAIAAGTVAALSPFLVQYAQEARMYSFLALFLTAAALVFLRAMRTGRWAYWIAFGVLAGISMYTQQLAAFTLVAFGLYALIEGRFIQRFIQITIAAGIALVIYAPWLVQLPSQLSRVGNYWVKQPNIIELFLPLWSFTFVDVETQNLSVIQVSITAMGLILIFALFLFLRQRRDRRELGFVLWMLFAPILIMWVFSQFRPVFLTRALIPSGVMFTLVVGWLYARARIPRLITAAIFVPYIIAVLFGFGTLLSWNTFPRPPFDEAVAFLKSQQQPDDPMRVVHANKLTALPMRYYDRITPGGLAQTYLQDAPGSPEDTLAIPTQEVLRFYADGCLETATGGFPRVWFVILREQEQQMISLMEGRNPYFDWFMEHYTPINTIAFNDLQVIEYRLQRELSSEFSVECE